MRRIMFAFVTSMAAHSDAADRFVIDPSHTYTVFEYSHWGLSLQQGRFDKNSGWIELDLDKKTGKVQIEIEVASVNTGSALFDTALRSASFFDVDRFPKIRFVSTNLNFDENQNVFSMEGELTIKSVTKKVLFELSHFRCRFMPLYLKSACGANGSTKILRSEFEVGRYTPFVSDEVTLHFAVEAIKD
ncbi:YceI family protein [Undibacterium sp. FT137W]|uniref:YceI family protein n=2 Tax=Undibacterium fentianense TaxID=2828728 RepID=A0A941E4C0_9BURK|nr:YceI family protein [Undibacterium fentianense]